MQRRVSTLCTIVISAFLSSCGGDNNELPFIPFDEIALNIESFSITTTNVIPGQSLGINWEIAGIEANFDIRFYISEDNTISSEDVRIIDEDCSFDEDDNCEAGKNIFYQCFYENDLSFDCQSGTQILRRNSLSTFLDQIPKSAFIIMEACGEDCENRALELTFQ